MNEYKSISKYLDKKHNKKEINIGDKLIKNFISKSLIACILFLLFLIGNKLNINFKTDFYDKVYGNTFSFATVNNWYKSKFGDVFPLENILPQENLVFSEKMIYESANLYKDGVALKVSTNYLVPLLENGIIIFIGEKEDYGNTVIVQQENGIDVWYCNINSSDINMYDYVEKGMFIGEAREETIYLLFQKDGEYLDYKNYI